MRIYLAGAALIPATIAYGWIVDWLIGA